MNDLSDGLDTRIPNYLNSLDTEGLTAEQVRSIIYAECMDKGQGAIKESAYRAKQLVVADGDALGEAVEALRKINDLCLYQSSGYARDCSLIAQAAITRMEARNG